MRQFLAIIVFFSLLLSVYGQEESSKIPSFSDMNIGFGIGRDYGGFGGRFTFLPAERIAVFGAAGYNMVGIGLNGGIYYRLSPQKRICPFIGVMYGYNGAIKVTGAFEFKKIYYGPTFAFGTEIWSGIKTDYFNIELILPLRPSDYRTDYDELKNMGVEFKVPSLPIGFSLGYHFVF